MVKCDKHSSLLGWNVNDEEKSIIILATGNPIILIKDFYKPNLAWKYKTSFECLPVTNTLAYSAGTSRAF